MIRTLNPVDLFRLSQRVIKSLDGGARPKLVKSSLDDELGFEHSKQEVKVHDCNGNAQPDKRRHARVGSSNPKSNPRAERKSDEANGNSREAYGEKIERRPDVFDFADAVAVTPGALADAAEIEAQSRQTCVRRSLRCTEDDLVVHRPPVDRVRMAHQRRETWLGASIPLEEGFKRPFQARD